MSLRIFPIIFGVLFWCASASSQSKNDSVFTLIENSVDIKEKVNHQLELIQLMDDSTAIIGVIQNIHIEIEGEEKENQASFHFDIAISLYKKTFYEIALEEINSSILLYKYEGDLDRQAESIRVKAKIERKLLQFDRAFTSYKQALELFELTGNIEKQISVYNSMGIIHKTIKNFPEAMINYHKAYELSKEYGFTMKLALTSVNLGVILKKQEKYEEALYYYDKAEVIYKNEDFIAGLADVYNNIGNIYRLQSRYHNALSYYHLAVSKRIESGEEFRLSYTYNNIALVYTELNEYTKAIDYLHKSEKLKIQYENFESLTSSYLNLSEIYLKIDDGEKFLYYSNKVRELSNEYGQNDSRRSNIVNKSRYEANKGDYKSAYIHLSSVYDELDTLDVESQKILTSVLQAQFEDEQDQQQIHEMSDAILLLDEQKNELKEKNAISFRLITGLGVLILILIFLAFLLQKKQKFLKEQTAELDKTNEQLRKSTVSIEEKEILLKEVHHRVKNNLQIIKSLIRLQNTDDLDTVSKNVLTDFELRISSMALVHESLYKKGDIASVKLNEYFRSLLDDILSVYTIQHDVELKTKIEVGVLDIDTLVPLGLLITEIVSNSMKYGVSINAKGLISLELKKINQNDYILLLQDNGDGFDFEERMAQNTLGIELISTLVEQLDGTLDFSSENGAFYRIKFKAQVKK